MIEGISNLKCQVLTVEVIFEETLAQDNVELNLCYTARTAYYLKYEYFGRSTSCINQT